MGTINLSLPSDGQSIDSSDVNTPFNTIQSAINGNLDNDNIKALAGIAGSKLSDNSIDLGAKASVFDGWIKITSSWSYASSTTVTVPSDAATIFSIGDKVKFDQTSTKYYYVTAVTATTLTLNGGTDYTVANAAISNIYYSKAASPLSFPQWFAYTPTLTGFSANQTAVYRFCLIGRMCYITSRRSADGTSNATGFTITAPITSANPGDYQWTAPLTGVNNGAGLTAPGLVSIANNTTTINLYSNYAAAAWSNANAKGADFTLAYAI